MLLGGKQRPKKFLYCSVIKLCSWESRIWSPEAYNCLLFGLMCLRSAADFTEEMTHSLHLESQISSVSFSSPKELIAMVKVFPSFLSHWSHCRARSSQNAACPVCLLMDYLRTPRWLPVCAPNGSLLLLLPQRKDSWKPLCTFPSQILMLLSLPLTKLCSTVSLALEALVRIRAPDRQIIYWFRFHAKFTYG